MDSDSVPERISRLESAVVGLADQTGAAVPEIDEIRGETPAEPQVDPQPPAEPQPDQPPTEPTEPPVEPAPQPEEPPIDPQPQPDPGHGEWPNTPEGEADVARFDQMVKDIMGKVNPDTGKNPTREEAEGMANSYLTDMKEGRRDAQGNPVTG